VTPDGGSVYVANEAAASVTVVATGTGKITATVPSQPLTTICRPAWEGPVA
jgi:YVTN family beta-propeller protein